VDRIVEFFSLYPGTNNPIFGLYDFGIREPLSGQAANGSFFLRVGSAIGRIPVKLPPGTWELQGRIQAEIPATTLTVPVTVVNDLDPFNFIAQQDLAASPVPIDIVGTIQARSGVRIIRVQLDAQFENDSIEREISLSANATGTAQLTVEAKDGVEAEGNVYLAKVKDSGELAFGGQFTLSGTASAGETLKLTIKFKRLTGFTLTQK
jgi:hypothetical protein